MIRNSHIKMQMFAHNQKLTSSLARDMISKSTLEEKQVVKLNLSPRNCTIINTNNKIVKHMRCTYTEEW